MRLIWVVMLASCTSKPTPSGPSASATPVASSASPAPQTDSAQSPPHPKPSTPVPQRTVLETSQSFVSPGGAHRVSVSSRTASNGRAVSQAVVASETQGSGLVAFDVSRVSMSFVWRSDDELVVRYPSTLPAPRIDATNDSFGFGGRGRVIYEAVPPHSIAPLQWAQAAELIVEGETQLERGTLVTLRVDGETSHSYSYYDVHEADSSAKQLQAQGYQGGGPSWAGIIHGLLVLHAPKLRELVHLDPESDGLAVRSTHRDALLEVAKLIAQAKRDPDLLNAAIQRAVADKQME